MLALDVRAKRLLSWSGAKALRACKKCVGFRKAILLLAEPWEVKMRFVTLLLTGVFLGDVSAVLAQSLDRPEGVYILSFEFRPVFRTGVEEKESLPTNAA